MAGFFSKFGKMCSAEESLKSTAETDPGTIQAVTMASKVGKLPVHQREAFLKSLAVILDEDERALIASGGHNDEEKEGYDEVAPSTLGGGQFAETAKRSWKQRTKSKFKGLMRRASGDNNGDEKSESESDNEVEERMHQAEVDDDFADLSAVWTAEQRRMAEFTVNVWKDTTYGRTIDMLKQKRTGKKKSKEKTKKFATKWKKQVAEHDDDIDVVSSILGVKALLDQDILLEVASMRTRLFSEWRKVFCVITDYCIAFFKSEENIGDASSIIDIIVLIDIVEFGRFQENQKIFNFKTKREKYRVSGIDAASTARFHDTLLKGVEACNGRMETRMFEVRGGMNRKESVDTSTKAAKNSSKTSTIKSVLHVRDIDGGVSFSPRRTNVKVGHYFSGSEYYSALADALYSAKRDVFIADWWFSPEIYLKRHRNELEPKWRLDNILQSLAFRGVKVYILLYKESAPLALASENVAAHMTRLSSNIMVYRHGPQLRKIFYSHHQKTVVIDQRIAFVGGIDLCLGRYDTPEHPVSGDSHIFKGLDHYNPAIYVASNHDQSRRPFDPAFDSQNTPRMPWHDFQSFMMAGAAADVALNFIQRWNFVARKEGEFTRMIIPTGLAIRRPYRGHVPSGSITHAANVQILRSISTWSGGARTESSIHRAIVERIGEAQKYIFIANQFFISGTASSAVKNKVAQAIVDRVAQSIREKSTFRVYIVLPIHPEGNPVDNSVMHSIMSFQRKTINEGSESVYGQLYREFPAEEVNDRIVFSSLRNYAILGSKAITNMVYVHAKLMICDDNVMMIGSANINDRSLRGSRDSELSALIFEKGLDTRHLKTMRSKIFASYLGISPSSVLLRDASSDSLWKLWMSTMSTNTAIYESVFPGLPSDSVVTASKTKNISEVQLSPQQEKSLGEINGLLVKYPQNYLKNESPMQNLLDDLFT